MRRTRTIYIYYAVLFGYSFGRKMVKKDINIGDNYTYIERVYLWFNIVIISIVLFNIMLSQ